MEPAKKGSLAPGPGPPGVEPPAARIDGAQENSSFQREEPTAGSRIRGELHPPAFSPRLLVSYLPPFADLPSAYEILGLIWALTRGGDHIGRLLTEHRVLVFSLLTCEES